MYLSQNQSVRLDELTLTMVRHKKPVKLLNDMVGQGITVTETSQGVYEIRGVSAIPTQIVVTRQAEGLEALKILTKDTNEEEVERSLRKLIRLKDIKLGDDNIRAVFNTFIAANKELFEKMRGSDMWGPYDEYVEEQKRIKCLME